MGKIKRERQKFHITTTEDKEPTAPKAVSKPKNNAAKKALQQQFDAVENIFAGINIQLDSINKLEDVPPPPQPIQVTAQPEERETDAKISEIQWNYKATTAEKNLTKKEKLKLKHAKLMEKIDVTQQARLKIQEQRKHKKSKSTQSIAQSPLPSRAEIKSILTPAAMKSTKPIVEKVDAKEAVKNIFVLPSFKDDLPALNIFKINPIKTGVAEGSKTISKGNGKQKAPKKQNFVKNVNLLKKLMAKKKK